MEDVGSARVVKHVRPFEKTRKRLAVLAVADEAQACGRPRHACDTAQVPTSYIQSGNVICESSLSEAALQKTLDMALAKRMGKRVPVAVRTAEELAAVVADDPFIDADPAKVGILFLMKPVGKGFLTGVSTTTGDEVRLGERVVYIHYPNGMGQTKLKLPEEAAEGTVRNLNTVRKLVEIAGE